jgi:hypothetical protein
MGNTFYPIQISCNFFLINSEWNSLNDGFLSGVKQVILMRVWNNAAVWLTTNHNLNNNIIYIVYKCEDFFDIFLLTVTRMLQLVFTILNLFGKIFMLKLPPWFPEMRTIHTFWLNCSENYSTLILTTWDRGRCMLYRISCIITWQRRT